jgi:hypothetical protein
MEPDVVVALSGHNDVFWSMRARDVNYYRSFQDDYFLRLSNVPLEHNQIEAFPDEQPAEEQYVRPELMAARLRRNVELSRAALQLVGADYCFALQPTLAASRKVRTPREERVLQRPGPGFTDAAREDSEFVARYAECRKALSTLKGPGYHFWDLTGVFDGDTGSDVFIDRCHFGDRGHDLIAKQLLERLTPVLKARFKQAGR